MAETRECYLCHRVGYRGFVPYGDWAWCCLNEKACRDRRAAGVLMGRKH